MSHVQSHETSRNPVQLVHPGHLAYEAAGKTLVTPSHLPILLSLSIQTVMQSLYLPAGQTHLMLRRTTRPDALETRHADGLMIFCVFKLARCMCFTG